MSTIDIIGFVLMAGVAAYVQTLTGFAFGLLLMGGVGLTAVMPLRDAAVVTGVLTLVNAAIMMTKGWRHVMRAELVLEVAYEHMQGMRFRHMARFRRWRYDKPPRDCTYAQLEVVPPQELMAIFAGGR